jgi:hypothetical protein
MTANLPALHNKLKGDRCLSYIGTEGIRTAQIAAPAQTSIDYEVC